MAEYIERSDATFFFENSKQTMWHKDDIAATISSKKNIPSADVVEIVRCKNCKYFDIEEGDALGTCMGKFVCISLGGELYPEPDYSCPYGERRSE